MQLLLLFRYIYIVKTLSSYSINSVGRVFIGLNEPKVAVEPRVVYVIIKAMRSLTVVGFILMFLGPLVVLLRSFGVILVDDMCTQIAFGMMVFLFGWGIYMYSDNERNHLFTINELNGQITRLRDELKMHIGQKDGGNHFKQSLQRDVQTDVTTIGFDLCDILTRKGKEDVGDDVC